MPASPDLKARAILPSEQKPHADNILLSPNDFAFPLGMLHLDDKSKSIRKIDGTGDFETRARFRYVSDSACNLVAAKRNRSAFKQITTRRYSCFSHEAGQPSSFVS